MRGNFSSSSSSPPAGSAGLPGFARAVSARWPSVLVRMVGCLVGVSLLWAVGAPVYATGLATIGRALIPFLESAPDTRYTVEGGNVLAHRPVWLPKQQRMAPLVQPLWSASANYGVPLLAALILATPGWSLGRRWRAMGIGLGLLTITQVAFLLVYIVATQQSPVMSPEGPIQLPGFS